MKEGAKTKSFTFYVQEDLWQKFARISRQNERTAAAQIRVLLDEFVTKHEKT